MGFPGAEPVYTSVAGAAMFPGAGSAMPGTWTVIAIVACIVVLAIGQASEAAKLKKAG